MPAPTEIQILNTICEFAVANPSSSAADIRDHLVSTYPGSINADSINMVNGALAEVFVENGFDNDPDPENGNWAKYRNRCAAVGSTVGVEINKALRPDFGSRPETQIFKLRIQRSEVVAAVQPIVDERNDLLTFRDLTYPLGNPGPADPSGSFVFSGLTALIAQLNGQIQGLNAQRDQIDTTIASLGG